MTLNTVLFYILAVLTGVSALGVVVTQNIVRAATWLLFALVGTAGIFFLLGADFVGAAQILVYVGGTLVLVVFGVMLTAQGPFISMRVGAVEWVISLAVGLLLYGVLAITLAGIRAPDPGQDRMASSVVLGESLLGLTEAAPQARITLPGEPGHAREPARDTRPRRPMAYLLPFEIVSVHLLVVLVGAAYLARAKRRLRASAPASSQQGARE